MGGARVASILRMSNVFAQAGQSPTPNAAEAIMRLFISGGVMPASIEKQLKRQPSAPIVLSELPSINAFQRLSRWSITGVSSQVAKRTSKQKSPGHLR